MLADLLYVACRSDHPDEGTVNTVKQKLKEKNIDIDKLKKWPVDQCVPEKT